MFRHAYGVDSANFSENWKRRRRSMSSWPYFLDSHVLPDASQGNSIKQSSSPVAGPLLEVLEYFEVFGCTNEKDY